MRKLFFGSLFFFGIIFVGQPFVYAATDPIIGLTCRNSDSSQVGTCQSTSDCPESQYITSSDCSKDMFITCCSSGSGSTSSGSTSSGGSNLCSSYTGGQCYTGSNCSSLWKISTSDCPQNGSGPNCCVPTGSESTSSGSTSSGSTSSGGGSTSSGSSSGGSTSSGSTGSGSSTSSGSTGSGSSTSSGSTSSGSTSGGSTSDCLPPDYEMKSGVCFPTASTIGLSDVGVVDLLMNIMDWLLAIFGFIAIIGFVISGIQYLTSAGDEDMIETAKRNMKYSVIGVLIGLSGLVIIYAIDNALRGTAVI